MAVDRLIPNRPVPDEIRIPVADKDLITYVVAFNVPNQKAFALWHPEFLDASGKLNKTGRARCTEFFSYAKNREYADSYAAYLKTFLNGGKSEAHLIEVDESRKDKALKSLLNQAMSMVESGDTLDPDTLKVLTEIFKKLGILKDEVEVQESPRRYLPCRCSECAYKLFVEKHVEGGEIINECAYCRTRRFAEENGWHYDPTKNLDLPPAPTEGETESNN